MPGALPRRLAPNSSATASDCCGRYGTPRFWSGASYASLPPATRRMAPQRARSIATTPTAITSSEMCIAFLLAASAMLEESQATRTPRRTRLVSAETAGRGTGVPRRRPVRAGRTARYRPAAGTTRTPAPLVVCIPTYDGAPDRRSLKRCRRTSPAFHSGGSRTYPSAAGANFLLDSC